MKDQQNSDVMELKPCPFCGAVPERWTEPLGEHTAYYTGCTNYLCAVSPSNTDTTQGNSDRGWNTRPDPAPVCDGKVREAINIINDLYPSLATVDSVYNRATITLITAAKEAGAVRRDYAGLVQQTIEQQLEITSLRAELAKQPERVTEVQEAWKRLSVKLFESRANVLDIGAVHNFIIDQPEGK